ncbi:MULTISPECIES: DUF1876 domain-containing protein [unclassified Streptomyces]|uniref:DUF1876 domain-containing protein n=1 Tax=unclassified Streptomyces TaxID=2593676 RepID=UPI0021C8BA45|nr:DUF1876 domain-containing protein [Streptomyces sp. FIT100]UUN30475.1 DUF1876 family protein [Streptomyces sp. FIT100]
MTRTVEWQVGLVLVEEDGTTRAQAVLDTGATTYTGHGVARCNPQDVDVPEIGDELAASRAMKDLATQLMRVANRELESIGAGPEGGVPYGWPEAAT